MKIKNKGFIFVGIFLVAGLAFSFKSVADKDICSSLSRICLVLAVLSLVCNEFYIRKVNLREHSSYENDIILKNRSITQYLSVVAMMVILTTPKIFSYLRYLKNDTQVYYNFDILDIAIYGALIISYLYLHIISYQVIYIDGIKLMNNEFIKYDYIEKITYREGFKSGIKYFCISFVKDGSFVIKDVEFKCKNDEEFVKTLIFLEKLTDSPIEARINI